MMLIHQIIIGLAILNIIIVIILYRVNKSLRQELQKTKDYCNDLFTQLSNKESHIDAQLEKVIEQMKNSED